MDIAADSSLELSTLSYDDTIPYEDQFATHPSIDMGRASLANRIGTTKVYLLSESAVARVGKVRRQLSVRDREWNLMC